jgi:hypothetical protein
MYNAYMYMYNTVHTDSDDGTTTDLFMQLQKTQMLILQHLQLNRPLHPPPITLQAPTIPPPMALATTTPATGMEDGPGRNRHTRTCT